MDENVQERTSTPEDSIERISVYLTGRGFTVQRLEPKLIRSTYNNHTTYIRTGDREFYGVQRVAFADDEILGQEDLALAKRACNFVNCRYKLIKAYSDKVVDAPAQIIVEAHMLTWNLDAFIASVNWYIGLVNESCFAMREYFSEQIVKKGRPALIPIAPDVKGRNIEKRSGEVNQKREKVVKEESEVRLEKIIEFLADNGFRPQKGVENEVIFPHEGNEVSITISDTDAEYYEVTRFGVLVIDNEDQAAIALEACSVVNRSLKVVKCYMRSDRKRVNAETNSLHKNVLNFCDHALRLINLVCSARSKIHQVYEELESSGVAASEMSKALHNLPKK
jgi:hypothetical protein